MFKIRENTSKKLSGGGRKRSYNGFTLIELLTIIAIFGMIAMLVFPKIGESTEDKKRRELEKIRIIVENAGKFYHSFNRDRYKITIDEMIKDEYITSNLINPETGERIDGCVRVIKGSDGFTTYNYTTCNRVDVKLEVLLNGGSTTQVFEEVYSDSTLIECKLETGRTHQIRVHMNYINHPVVNDPVYGYNKLDDKEFGQMLHAKEIGFVHPITKEFMSFKVDVPQRFNEILEIYKNK